MISGLRRKLMYKNIYEEFYLSPEDKKIIEKELSVKNSEVLTSRNLDRLFSCDPIFSNVRYIDCVGFSNEKWPESKLHKICDDIYLKHMRITIPKYIVNYYKNLFIPTKVLNNDIQGLIIPGTGRELIIEYFIQLFQKECLEAGTHYLD